MKIHFVLIHVSLWTLGLSAAQADSFMVFNEGLKHLPEIQEMIAPAPLLKDAYGRISFRGKYIRTIPKNPVAKPGEPDFKVRVEIQPYGRLGENLANPIVISYHWGGMHFDFDSLGDLKRIFANLDEVLGVSWESDQIRPAMISLMDPQNELNLGPALPAGTIPQDRLKHGWMSYFVLNGWMSMEERIAIGTQDPTDPRLMPVTGNTFAFLKGISIGKKYPTVSDPGFVPQAIALYSAICDVADLELDQVPPQLQGKGERLRSIARELQDVLIRSLRVGNHADQIFNPENPELPLTWRDMHSIALSIIQKSSVFLKPKFGEEITEALINLMGTEGTSVSIRNQAKDNLVRVLRDFKGGVKFRETAYRLTQSDESEQRKAAREGLHLAKWGRAREVIPYLRETFDMWRHHAYLSVDHPGDYWWERLVDTAHIIYLISQIEASSHPDGARILAEYNELMNKIREYMSQSYPRRWKKMEESLAEAALRKF